MKEFGRHATAVLVLLGVVTGALAGDWPQWQGPNRNGVSAETGLLSSWPADGPQLLWRFEDCGIGFSGPAIVGNRLYIMGARRGVEQLLAVDITEGREIWSLDVGEVFEIYRGNGPRSTPTVVGDRVYALGARGDLVCAGASDGRLLWKASMTELGGKAPEWGYCESVLVDGQRLICTPGGSRGTLAALDSATGKVLWRSSEFTDPAQYASPIAVDWGGVRQYIQLTMNSLVGISAADGQLLWKSAWQGRTAVVPTPIFRDGFVYIASGYGVGCKLVQLGSDQSVRDVYVNKNMKNHHGGVVLIGEHLYGYSDGYGWVSQEFRNGEIVWSERDKLGKGSLTYADGRLYCLSEKEGLAVLVEATPRGWIEHGRFQMTPDSRLREPQWLFWTHPVVSNGRLYLRNQEMLFSYDVKAR